MVPGRQDQRACCASAHVIRASRRQGSRAQLLQLLGTSQGACLQKVGSLVVVARHYVTLPNPSVPNFRAAAITLSVT
jgi:hypothetical protein